MLLFKELPYFVEDEEMNKIDPYPEDQDMAFEPLT